MSTSRYRIPRLPAAALVLGGACGGDDNSASDVSASRIRSVVSTMCKHYAECEPDYFEMSYDSQADCVASYEDDLNMYVDTQGKVCVDAYLDWMECVNRLDCAVDADTKCAAYEKKADKVCDFDDDADDDDDDDDASRSSVRFRSLRIPR